MKLIDFEDKPFSYEFDEKMWFKGRGCERLDCKRLACSVCISEWMKSFNNLKKIEMDYFVAVLLNKLDGKVWKEVLEEKEGKVFPLEDQKPMSHTERLYPYNRGRTNEELIEFYGKFQDHTLVQLTLCSPLTILGFVDINGCYYPMIWDPAKDIEKASEEWVSRGRKMGD